MSATQENPSNSKRKGIPKKKETLSPFSQKDSLATEGVNLIKALLARLDTHISKQRREVLKQILNQRQEFLGRWNESIERHVNKIAERLNDLTTEEMQDYEKRFEARIHRLKVKLDEQKRKALERYDVTAKADIKKNSETFMKL